MANGPPLKTRKYSLHVMSLFRNSILHEQYLDTKFNGCDGNYISSGASIMIHLTSKFSGIINYC